MNELVAPTSWRTIEFISDLHLQPADPATHEAWRRYLSALRADALFILGDLFEAWVGDDAAREPGFAADCAADLARVASARPVFFLHGNRDFLVGEAFAHATGITLLPDPTVLAFAGQRWVLTHGDALCLEDVDYLRFRAVVRSEPWQREFLARPIAERRAIAAGLRERSQATQRDREVPFDVDDAAAVEWLTKADARTMIHGHTHRPAAHALEAGRWRWVLTDWDARAGRAEALRITHDARIERVPLA